jgi:hypothetical protein
MEINNKDIEQLGRCIHSILCTNCGQTHTSAYKKLSKGEMEDYNALLSAASKIYLQLVRNRNTNEQ